jgi:hypothetical protein
MASSTRLTFLIAAFGATALLATGFSDGLSGAGQYKDLSAVRFGFIGGVWPAYFLVLWLASWAAGLALRVSNAWWCIATLVLLSALAGMATLIAPLLPSASLAVVCKSAALCPDAANPILWAWLNLITSLPPLPAVAGFVCVASTALLLARRGRNHAG